MKESDQASCETTSEKEKFNNLLRKASEDCGEWLRLRYDEDGEVEVVPQPIEVPRFAIDLLRANFDKASIRKRASVRSGKKRQVSNWDRLRFRLGM